MIAFCANIRTNISPDFEFLILRAFTLIDSKQKAKKKRQKADFGTVWGLSI